MSILLFIVLILFSKTVYAENYFDFTSSSYLIGYDQETDIDFKFNLVGYKVADFTVRPVLDTGFAYIQKEEEWVSSYDFWENMPPLNSTKGMKIISEDKVSLGFKIQNIITGEIYEVAPKDYYPYRFLQDSMSNLKLTRDVIEEEPVKIEKQTFWSKMIKYLDEIFQ